MALRGGGGDDDLPEEFAEGKDVGEWSHFRDDSILESKRDPDDSKADDDSQASSVIDWGDGADPITTDPTTLPFGTVRERLETPQNFTVWVKDYLYESATYDLPPDPPFKGVEWVEELEKVFDRMQAEWEEKQMDASTAQADGPYHPRQGGFHKNPALDLTTSGCMERHWDPARLSHYLRLQAEQGGSTTWQERAAEDFPDPDSKEEEDVPAGFGSQVAGNKKGMLPGQKYEPDYQAFRNFGEEDWGHSLATNSSMDANTDPWFQVNQDKDCPTNPFEGDWVEKSLEEHFQAQLAKFSANCRENYQQKYNETYAGRMTSRAGDDDRLIYDCIDHSASVSYKNRQRTCPYATNKWVNNIGSMPGLEWNPETPLEKTSIWSAMPPSFNSFNGPAKLSGIDGKANDGEDDGGWRNIGDDHLIHVQPEEEFQEEPGAGGNPYL